MPARLERAPCVAAVLLILGVAWAAALLAAPAAVQPGRAAAVRLGGAIVYAIGSRVCHQRPERSFATAGVAWPVCGRCAGLYLSFAAAALLLAFTRGMRSRLARPAPDAWRIVLVLALVPTMASWALERMHLVPGTPALRAWLAAPAGIVIAALLAALGQASGGPEVD
jgi:uncharacterized membrane protein